MREADNDEMSSSSSDDEETREGMNALYCILAFFQSIADGMATDLNRSLSSVSLPQRVCISS